MPWATWKSPKEMQSNEEALQLALEQDVREPIDWSVSGKLLRCHDLPGKQDPYVKIFVGSPGFEKEVLKSEALKKTSNPEWNAAFHFSGLKRHLKVEVWDHNRMGKDKKVGECSIDLSEDDEFVRNDYPMKGVPFLITRSLGDKKGSIELKFVPCFEHHFKTAVREANTAADRKDSWKTEEFTIPEGKVELKVPQALQDRPIADDGVLLHKIDDSFMMVMRTKGKDTEGKFVDKASALQYAKEAAKSPTFPLPSVGLQPMREDNVICEEGALESGGHPVVWYNTYTDFTKLNGYAFGTTTVYLFAVKDAIVELHLTTFDPRGGYPAVLFHFRRFGFYWNAVLESLTITPNAQ